MFSLFGQTSRQEVLDGHVEMFQATGDFGRDGATTFGRAGPKRLHRPIQLALQSLDFVGPASFAGLR
jgi:hypothetical protein